MKRYVVIGSVIAVIAVAVGIYVVTGSDGDPADLATLRAQKQTVIADPDAETDCEALDHPCRWDEASDKAWSRTRELLDDVTSVATDAGAESFDEQLAAIEEYLLQADDVASVDWNPANPNGLEFRVDGGLPVFVLTAAAGRLPAEPDGTPLSPTDREDDLIETDDDEGALGPNVDADFDLISYEVTNEPAQERRNVLIVSPYDEVDGAEESAAVNAVFERHEDFDVTMVLDDGADVESLYQWADADAVHLVSHGMTSCVGSGTGRRCRAGFGLKRVPPRADRKHLDQGITILRSVVDDTDRYFVMQDFFHAGFSDAVVFFNSCQSAGDAVANEPANLLGRFESSLGWDHDVYVAAAEKAATRFWEVVAEHGLDSQYGYDTLVDESLDEAAVRTDILGGFIRDLHQDIVGVAVLHYSGSGRRVRDVITSFHGGKEIEDETTIRSFGAIGDGIVNVIPDLEFEVEGVPDRVDGPVRIRVLIDDKPVVPDFSLVGGTATAQQTWNDWRVSAQNVTMPFDLTAADVDGSNPRPHTWEVRVSDDGFATYSATKADPVYFSGDLVAKGPLPTFTTMASQLPSNAVLEGNELEIRFNTAGGPLQGEFKATMIASGFQGGFWEISLQGTYDPDAGTMGGIVTGNSQGGFPVTSPSGGSGEWSATVDLDARVVEGTMLLNGTTERFRAVITN